MTHAKALADNILARAPRRYRECEVRLVLAHGDRRSGGKLKKGSRWRMQLEIKERSRCARTLRRGICSAIQGST